MSWYDNIGPENDVAVSSRIRLARNISGIPFPSVMNDQQREEVNNLVKKALLESNTPFAKSLKFIQMKDIPENERFSMVERHIISREFVSNCENKAIIISDDESISIMLGEEDHIRIQVIKAGLDVAAAYDVAEQIDSLLCNLLDIAFDNKLGFLTSCPTNLGTGLRASVMLHLPLLKSSGEMGVLSEQIGKIGFTVRGMYGEGTKAAASLYQISNQITLGITEKNAIDNLNLITMQLIEKERKLRESLNKIKAEDISMRAFGILSNARIISSQEMMKLLNELKLGISLGIIEKENLNPIKLLIEGQPFMLMRKFGEMTADERDIYRANMLREALQ